LAEGYRKIDGTKAETAFSVAASRLNFNVAQFNSLICFFSLPYTGLSRALHYAFAKHG
jgi:hypothetical protein